MDRQPARFHRTDQSETSKGPPDGPLRVICRISPPRQRIRAERNLHFHTSSSLCFRIQSRAICVSRLDRMIHFAKEITQENADAASST